MINEFREENYFLSNFYQGKEFIYKGTRFDNAEAAFQSQKDLSKQQDFELMNPSLAKKLGRRVNLRDDWDKEKDKIMFDILYHKFQDKELKEKLLATNKQVLIQGNLWHDNYWGICMCDKCKNKDGKNKLGELLMNLREFIKITEK